MVIANIFGILASILVLSAFVPQIIKGYRTKKLEDVSYFLMILLITGMSLWIIYGFLVNDWIIIGANVTAASFNVILILMKRYYEKKSF